MPCYFPLRAWQLPELTESGKRKVTFTPRLNFSGSGVEAIQLPCGQCIGCRLERSRQWAVRLMHESQLHDRKSFLTLTYAEMPEGESLNLQDIQLFLKRLRKSRGYTKLRFFQCGEYGDLLGRPHHHMILFGEDFSDDRTPIEESQSGLPQWESRELTRLWSHGRATIGDVTFESAAYVARYSLKKMTGPKSSSHYRGRKPEYVTMSRRPGIGAGWLEKFGLPNVYNHDSVVMRGLEMLPPKYYDKLLEKVDLSLYERIKQERRPDDDPLQPHHDQSPERRRVRAKVKRLTIKSALKRGVE